MKGTIFLIGWRGARVPRGAEHALRLDPRAVYRESFSGCSAVILGPRALEELSPRLVWSALGKVRNRAILCADADVHYRVVKPWTACGFPPPVTPDALLDALAELEAKPRRPEVTRDKWLPRQPRHGTPAARATAAIPRLRNLRVQAWADALGWTRGQLLAVCKAEWGVSAKNILLWYVRAMGEEMKAEGTTTTGSAASLGYADARSLRRALQSGRSGGHDWRR